MALSPMMQQYLDIREKYPDTIILFRLGDFYEMFFDQAELCSRELELTLTGKECGLEERAPMCGIPFHAVEGYIVKLVDKGYKVGICEQVEDPKEAKGLVKRDVIKVITPGTITENTMLDEHKNNYIANIYMVGKQYALSYADISTGECFVTHADNLDGVYKIIDETLKIRPKELVLEDLILSDSEVVNRLVKKQEIYISRYLNQDESLVNDMPMMSEAFTLAERKSLTLLLNYIADTQKQVVSQLNKITSYDIEASMRLDVNTRRNLEITESNRERTKRGSILWVLDKTTTAIGARQIRKWVESPMLSKKNIDERLDAVESLKNDVFVREDIIELLKNVHDIERLASKMSNANTNARDLVALKNSFKVLPSLKATIARLLTGDKHQYLSKIYDSIDELKDMCSLIDTAIVDDPPITIKEGGLIKKGYNAEVDEYRSASTEGKNWLMELEAKERDITGIKGLKVGFNRVFGYYIEITRSNYSQIPEDRYIRKQTLADKERFITPELKELENKILGSEEKLVDLEYKLFAEVREKVAREIVRIQKTAMAIGVIDSLCSFAKVAETQNYVRPNITHDGVINIKEGRHPVVEKTIKGSEFIPNDTYIDSNTRFHIITGPNMAGKSTYMRQVAVITYMAQIGSFVPATEASISIVDRIFTRVGASDDLAGGESTFMVEMTELSNILENATSNSLVILDEIGRGTSTYDGMAIAWATVEHMADKEKVGAKTLFATHYHELNELEGTLEGVKNYSVAVKEKGDDVIFLRKIVEGPADESYGIYVAKLAGVPSSVVGRAKKILNKLEEDTITKKAKANTTKVIDNNNQINMFNFKLAEVGRMLDKLALDELSAKEALDVLYKLKEKME
ncbi:MAG: DNA mismatch repair protein MutS [Clostridia bacterium]|nr:DNA mismatch repair protein MutS [Clostridia bacterium]